MLNIKKWWSMLAVSPGGSRAVKAPADPTRSEELRYWWLMPGDATYYTTRSPATTDPQTAAE